MDGVTAPRRYPVRAPQPRICGMRLLISPQSPNFAAATADGLQAETLRTRLPYQETLRCSRRGAALTTLPLLREGGSRCCTTALIIHPDPALREPRRPMKSDLYT